MITFYRRVFHFSEGFGLPMSESFSFIDSFLAENETFLEFLVTCSSFEMREISITGIETSKSFTEG
jgi:hypothetical protein